MIKTESGNNITKVCDLNYLTETMGGKKHLIKDIMDVFLKQIPEELHHLNDAILKADYPIIKSIAHTMKSSVSIMGISVLTPVLQEMESLASAETSPDSGREEKIKELGRKVNAICKLAVEEIENEKHNYI